MLIPEMGGSVRIVKRRAGVGTQYSLYVRRSKHRAKNSSHLKVADKAERCYLSSLLLAGLVLIAGGFEPPAAKATLLM